MNKNCLNTSDPNIAKIVKEFGEVTTSKLIDKYYPDTVPTYEEFVSKKVIKEELGIIPISKVKDEIGTSFPKEVSNRQLSLLKRAVSITNNKIKDTVYLLFNMNQRGQSDLYTWGLRKVKGNIDIQTKLDRALQTSDNSIKSNDKIDELRKKLPKETPNQEIQENKEYFENDEPFTRNSSSTKPNTTNNTNQQGTLFSTTDTRVTPKLIQQEKERFEKEGISLNQKNSISLVNKLLYKSITPLTYDIKRILKKGLYSLFVGRSFEGLKESINTLKENNITIPTWAENLTEEQYNKREDAWLLSNGLPQKHNTFKYIGKGFTKNGTIEFNENGEDIYDFVNPIFDDKKIDLSLSNKKQFSSDGGNFVMGNYWISKGRDTTGYFIKYTDRWDLDIANKFIQQVIDKTQKPFIVTGKLYKALTLDKQGESVFYYTSVSNNPDIVFYNDFMDRLGIGEEIINEDVSYKNNTLEEGLQWLKEVNPNVQPEIVQGLIDGIANGSYNSNLDLITLSEEFANKKTVKHEFLHKILASLPFKQREAILNEASKKYGIARGKSKTTTKYSQSQQNEINYALKAVDLLQSDKAKQVFNKGEKNKWTLDKILSELNISREQKNLILDLDVTENKANVILPIGTSGSGKSTFIKSLPQENLVVIEPDSMRVEFTGDINDKSKDKEIYEEAANRAIQAIKQGKQVVFDTTNLTKDKRLPFIEAIKKEIPTANIQYKLMELNPELAKQRIKADIAAGKNRANVPDATIDRHAESYKQMLEDIKSEPISEFKSTDLREQLALELVSKYNYTVEINTAKSKEDYFDNDTQEVTFTTVDGIRYYGDYQEGYFLKNKKIILKEEFVTALNNNRSVNNSSYYSNLTVPGGTNYTENEISTPLITPSIKGHAQFSTDNGIGWFRSDEQAETVLENYYVDYVEALNKYVVRSNINGKITTIPGPYSSPESAQEQADKMNKPSQIRKLGEEVISSDGKTRRILEVQSDLFQKGRDRSSLVGDFKFKVEEYGEDVGVPDFEAMSKPEDRINNSKENQFLQLLNKDSNWVTFFIKSIIQDSAKKGYEKVLFPTGNTASKVEGHTTLEEFKKQKEDRLKQLNTRKQRFTSLVNKEELPSASESMLTEAGLERELEDINNEIAQLKQELERIDKEGFGALKPIYNFYENTVTNILNKTYGKDNVKIITDEYGNTWNEVTITPNMAKEAIKFQSPKLQYTGDLAIEEKIAEEAENSKDEIVAKTPLQKFIQSIKNLLRNIFKERDKISRLLRDMNQGRFNFQKTLNDTEVRKILNTPIEIEQEVTPPEDNTVEDLVEIKESEVRKKLKEILNILGITIKEDAQLPKDILAKVDMVQKLISFSKGELTEDNFTEEVIHLIVNIIEQKDPILYNKMISEIWKFNIYKEVLDTYRTDPEYQTKEGKPDMAKLKKEAVVKLLVAKLVDNTNINDTKNIFGALWDKASKFISNLFAQIPSYQRDIFEDFANDIVTKDNLVDQKDSELLKEGVFYSKRMNKAGMFANILNKTKNLFGKEKVKDAYITVPTIENPEEIFNILKALDKETSLVEAKEINPKTGKEEDVTYYVTGTGNKKRVSTILQEVKTNIGNYKNIDETELSAFIKNEKMMQGTKIHSTIEEIASRYVDLETGFLRITPLSRPENIDIPEKYYTILENHLKDRFLTYPKDTKFMVELKVVNEVYGYAGTIDFLAILPTGQIDILDWKSMDLTSKIAGKTIKKEEVHALTKEVHKQQLALYKQALMSVGIRDFRQTRTIPIIVENNIKKINKDKSFEDPKNLTITLSFLEIGMVDTTKETKNYLLPISTSNEKVFDDVSNQPIPFLNDLIDKLEAYKKHSLEQRNQATTLDRDRLLDQIQRTDKTIQELRSKKTTKLLVTIFEDELFNIDALSEKRFSFLEDNKDLTDLTPEQQNELREYFNKMNENYEFLNSFVGVMPESLEELLKINSEISPELAQSLAKVRKNIQGSEVKARKAVSHNMNLMGKLLGMDDNVTDIDVKTGTLTTIFSLYSRPELSLQMFTRLQKTINYLRDKEVQTFDTKMSNLMQGLTSWAKKTGNNIEQVYSKIYDKENKRLFYKFKKEYATTLYEKREEAFQKYREIVNNIPFQLSSTEKNKQIQKEYRAYITPFLKENYDIDKYVKLYEEAYKEYKKVVDEYIFDADPFENEAIREQKLDDWEYKHNIFTNPKALMTSGYNRNELLFEVINEDKWLSDEYRELIKPENKELFDFYQQLSFILEDANNEGLIDSLNNLPEVKNDSFKMFKYLKAGLFKNYLLSKYYAFYDRFLTNTYRNSDRTDPFTNKTKRKIPRKYSNSFFLKRKKDESPEEYQKRYNEEKKLHYMTLSTDLFYIFSVFGHHLIEYKLMKEYESRFQLLSLVENQKSKLIDISNTTGEVQYSVDDSGMEYRAKDSKPNETQDDNKTSRDLLRHIDNYLYSDKLAPEGAIKNIVDWLYNLTTQVNLGYTYTAPLTNLMAGLVNSSLNNNTYYNSKDFKNNIIPAIKDKNSPINTKTFEKLNNLFNPFVEMTDQVYSTNKYKSTEKRIVNFSKAALFLYSAGDHVIQNKIIASIYYGTTIDENNNIISVEDYINNKYPDRYSLSPKERLVLAKKIDKEIKEYKKTNSLYSLIAANKVNLNAQNTILLTSIIEDTISKTLGNYNQQDINTFQTQWIAKFVYQHKKWLGETIATRLEGFAVNNNTKQLEWGRYRLMADFLFSATQKALKKMLFYNMSSILPDMVVKNTTLNNTLSVEDIAKERYKVMQVEYKKKTNKDLPTTENEFIRFYVRQHENTERELKTLLTLLLLSKFLLPLLAGGGGDDENKEKDIYGTALEVLITVTTRSLREQSFTINPEQLKIMLLQGPVPVIGTAWNILDAGIITPTKEIYFGLKGDTKALKTNRVIDKGLNATPLKNINKLGKQISPDYRKFLNARRPKIQ